MPAFRPVPSAYPCIEGANFVKMWACLRCCVWARVYEYGTKQTARGLRALRGAHAQKLEFAKAGVAAGRTMVRSRGISYDSEDRIGSIARGLRLTTYA